MLNETNVEKIWFIVSPLNPLKKSRELLDEYSRLHLVRLAIDEERKFKALDIEFKLPKPSYTIDTITHLKEKYHGHTFTIIMGSDSFQNISKWKNKDQLVRENDIIVFRRRGFEILKSNESNILILDQAPLLDISATSIRKLIGEGKSVRYMLTDAVREEIEKSGYYRNSNRDGLNKSA